MMRKKVLYLIVELISASDNPLEYMITLIRSISVISARTIAKPS